MKNLERAHSLLQKRHFPVWPWLLKLLLMGLSLSILGHFKYQKLKPKKRTAPREVIIPATR